MSCRVFSTPWEWFEREREDSKWIQSLFFGRSTPLEGLSSEKDDPFLAEVKPRDSICWAFQKFGSPRSDSSHHSLYKALNFLDPQLEGPQLLSLRIRVYSGPSLVGTRDAIGLPPATCRICIMMISAFHFRHLIDKLPTKLDNYYYNEKKRLVKLVETTKCT